jgi:peptide alpha-N-acetyltransferase
VDLIHTFGKVHAHFFYKNAAKAAVRTHLLLHNAGSAAEAIVDGVSLLHISEEERKKALKKAKKAESKTKVVDGEKKVEDQFGTSFVIGVDHLSQAVKFLKPILDELVQDIEIFELASKVYLLKSM